MLAAAALVVGITVVIDPARATAAPSPTKHMAAAGEVLIKFREGVPASEQRAVLDDLGATRIAGFASIHASQERITRYPVEEAVARYAHDSRIAYIEPNYYAHTCVVPNDSLYGQLYGLHNTGQTGGVPGADIHAEAAWDVTTGSSDVLVAVIDTGIDATHPDLAANIFTNPGEIPGNGIDDDGNGYVDDVHGWDFANNDNDAFDDHGHGTHVAGIIGAVGDNALGVVGVSWRCRLLPVKFLGADGWGTYANAIQAIEYATQMDARIMSNSWSGWDYSQAMRDAIHAASEAGVLCVCAAANDELDNDTYPHYPASFDEPNVVAVAATDDFDQLAVFSDYGLHSVDLAAPGVQILSTMPGGGYARMSGTSMATPYVSGAAALLLARYPSLGGVAAKNVLLSRVDPLPGLAGRLVTGGRLNAIPPTVPPDTIPPSTVTPLPPTQVDGQWVELRWIAGGGDHDQGTATAFELRYATEPLTAATYEHALPVSSLPQPLPSGSTQTMRVEGLDFATTYYFAIRATDALGNQSGLALFPSVTTLPPPHAEIGSDVLDATLQSGTTTTRELTIRNTGASELRYRLDHGPGRETSTPFPNAVFRPESPPQPDTAYIRAALLARQVMPMRAEFAPRRTKIAEKQAGGLRALLLIYSSDAHEIRDALLAFPDVAEVDTLSVRDGAPDLAVLQRYHTVITALDRTYDPGWSTADTSLGNRLADYVDSGGGLVITPLFDPHVIYPQDRLLAGGYLPFSFGWLTASSTRFTVGEMTHPILAGVHAITANLFASVNLGYSSRQLASWSTGNPLVATKGDRIAGINLYIAESGYWSGDGALLLHNAACWTGAAASMVWSDPDSGTVAPGETVTVPLTMDATRLRPDDYRSTFVVRLNDPAQAAWITPSHVYVPGTPGLRHDIVMQSERAIHNNYCEQTEHLFVVPPNLGTSTITLLADGDYSDDSMEPEYSPLLLESRYIGTVGRVGADCVTAPGAWTVDSADIATAAADSLIKIRVQNPFDVSPFCEPRRHIVRLAFPPPAGALDFDTLMVGRDSTITLQVANPGNDTLIVQSMTSDVPGLAVDAGTFTLSPWSHVDVPVRFAATSAGRFAGSLTTVSNDMESRWRTVPVACTVVDSARIQVAPDSLVADLPAGGTATGTLTISNTGGSALSFWSGVEAEALPLSLRSKQAREASDPRASDPPEFDLLVWDGSPFAYKLVAALAALPEVRSVELGNPTKDLDGASLRRYSAIVAVYMSGEAIATTAHLLADYLDDGGALVLSGASGAVLEEDVQFKNRYLPLLQGAGALPEGGLVWFDATHPIMQGFSGIDGLTGAAVEVAPGAQVVARSANDVPFIATLGHRVVALNCPLTDWPGPYPYATRLIYNSALWASTTKCVRLLPGPTIVPAGSTMNATVLFDALEFEPGERRIQLAIHSNSAATPTVLVPVTLRIVGLHLSADAAPLDFGQAYPGDVKTDTLRFRNRALAPVRITSVLGTAPPFSAASDTFSLAPGDSRSVYVTFSPTVAGDYATSLRFFSGDTIALAVTLVSKCVPPPAVTVDPVEVQAVLAPGERTSHAVILSNNGRSPLKWSLLAQQDSTHLGQTVFFDDMEHGPNAWTHYAFKRGYDSWGMGRGLGSNPTTSWSCLYESYYSAVPLDCGLLSPPIHLTRSLPPIAMHVNEVVSVFYGDYCILDVSSDDGNTWTPLRGADTGGMARSGVSTFDLSRWIGSTVRVRFHFVTTSLRSDYGRGWSVDDVTVTTGAASWLSASAVSGEIAAGASQAIDLELNAAGLEYGVHTETLRILTNDPVRPVVTVPATLRVDDATPVAISIVSTFAEPGSVHLQWYAPSGAGGTATVYRRTDQVGWAALAQASADGSGVIVYDDRTVAAGERYAYRLGVESGGTTHFTTESWVNVPQPRVLALEGFTPNPAVRDVAVAFSLPDAERATLELVDIAGRRVASSEVGTAGPGRHVVSFGSSASLHAGVYLVRLRHAGRSIVRKCVIVP